MIAVSLDSLLLRFEEPPRMFEEPPRRFEEPPRRFEEPPRRFPWGVTRA
jgi:hypothetical protein